MSNPDIQGVAHLENDTEQALAAMSEEELRDFATALVFAIDQQHDLADAESVIDEWLRP